MSSFICYRNGTCDELNNDGSEIEIHRRDIIARDVLDEFICATNKYPPFNSAHEGYAILFEEVDELWDLVKVKDSQRDLDAMRQEAIQVAAMAIRFITDVCDKEKQ